MKPNYDEIAAKFFNPAIEELRIRLDIAEFFNRCRKHVTPRQRKLMASYLESGRAKTLSGALRIARRET